MVELAVDVRTCLECLCSLRQRCRQHPSPREEFFHMLVKNSHLIVFRDWCSLFETMLKEHAPPG